VPENGVFSLTLEKPLTEGDKTVTITAQSNDLLSLATPIMVTVDTQPPAVAGNQAIVLPSLAARDVYDLIVPATADVTAMKASSGENSVALVRDTSMYRGQVAVSHRGATAGSVRVDFADAAGNSVSLPLFNSDHFSNGVEASASGPATRALQVIFASRAFLIAFFALVLLIGLVNVSMNWRRHHHPALLGLVLLLYVAGSLALI
jgi:hypothetical protein